MARMLKFKEGAVLIAEGDEDTAAYLIHRGWVQVMRRTKGGVITSIVLGPGEIIGELGLAGLVSSRTATVKALTDCEVEYIDRGALIRLVNGPGSRLAPLLAALFSRLKMTLIEEEADWAFDDTLVMYAKVEGKNDLARQALCNQQRMVSRLPWVFGAYNPPQSVTDLFRQPRPADVKLCNAGKSIRECHLCLEEAPEGGLRLHLMQHGDYCELDETRLGYGKVGTIVPLVPGPHTLVFGEASAPYIFDLDVFV